ncbi:MAG: 16S rRNA (adenine(1518)-N(6)/adenine(1519)-N(6))-dimethyltransferase [Desulfovibrio sp.]|nr:16S rRNA (adenine(1518)-N(6)/adenine(1519)-N(6))-dimethyltransferase [Desulfovibrio sp.]
MNSVSETEKQCPAAKRSLGQHFLRDPNIARKIVGLLRLTAEDSVLEIGPGPGALTRFIADGNPARLLVVEKDAYWAKAAAYLLAEYGPVTSPVAEKDNYRAAYAKISRTADVEIHGADESPPADAGRLRVLHVDALTLPFEHFSTGWKIIGNLPYNIASPLLWELFSRMPAPARAVFMLQKEVGLRLTATPSSRAYGALSVWLQSFSRPHASFVVPPHVFHPRPKVDSVVLVFEPLTVGSADNRDRQRLCAPAAHLAAPAYVTRVQAGLSCSSAHLPCSRAELAGTLHACFGMRRKQMGRIVASRGISPHSLEALGINPRSRPENLTPEEFQRVAAARLFV